MNNTKWVSLWGNAVSQPVHHPERYARDVTLRYIIMPTLDGEALRLTFTNYEGGETVSLQDVTVARTGKNENEIDIDTLTAVTFGGSKLLTMESGETVLSDEIPFEVHRGECFSVSFYVNDFTEMGSGISTSGPLTKAWFARGRYAAKAVLPLEEAKKFDNFYFLNTVDVLASEKDHAIVAFGDSITQQSWPEQLTQRILEENIGHVSVVRRAIGGSRVLRAYTNLENIHYGRKGLERFPQELGLTSGASAVVVLHGINDLIHPVDNHPFRNMGQLPDAETLEEGLRYYIDAAHFHGVKIYLATIPPFGKWGSYSDEKEAIRCEVNEWIRTNDEADGFVDFAAILQDESHPNTAREDYNSGDGLHPSLTGAFYMAHAIPEEWMK